MNSRERVFRAIEFAGPDRIPTMHSWLEGAMLRHREKLQDLFRRYPSDFGSSDHSLPQAQWHGAQHEKEYTDEWGIRWKERYDGIQGQPKGHPLEDWSALEHYVMPSTPPLSGEQVEERKAKVALNKQTFYQIGEVGCFFERLQWLRGYESLLIDLAEGRPEIALFADRLLKYNLAVVEYNLLVGVDALSFSDDWGTQERLMIRPALWREFFKPRYKKMFDLVHAAGKHVYFHSDGMILEIVPDLIEIGVNILNPQFSCMDLKALAALTRGKVCISTDLDRQYVLPFGTPEQVREYVRQVVETLWHPRGGLIARGEIGPDVPLENAEAMFQAFAEFGVYRN